MGRCTRYCKEELLDMLHEYCPEAVAKLPSPDTFTFCRGSGGTYKLSVGTTHGLVRRREHELWVVCGGTAKPYLDFKSDVNWNGSFNRQSGQEGSLGNSFFSKMSKNKSLYPFSEQLKAVVGFVFVYCGKQKEFVDFGFGKGLDILVKELKCMMSRDEEPAGKDTIHQDAHASTAEAPEADTVKIPSDDHVGQEHLDENLQQSSDKLIFERPKKRSLSVETDDRLVEKKARLD
jgi:hypothetical protein